MARDNKEVASAVAEYEASLKAEQQRIDDVKKTIAEIMPKMAVPPTATAADTEWRWVPTDLLRGWVEGKPAAELAKVAEGAPSILSQHGRLRPAPPAKRISKLAFDAIVAVFTEASEPLPAALAEPPTQANDHCMESVTETVSGRVLELGQISRYSTSLHNLEASAAGAPEQVWFDKAWVREWKARAAVASRLSASLSKSPWELLTKKKQKKKGGAAAAEVVTPADAKKADDALLCRLNEGLFCEHGALTPDAARRALYPQNAWTFFEREAKQARQQAEESAVAGLRPLHAFSAECPSCSQCDQAHAERVAKAADSKSQIDTERNAAKPVFLEQDYTTGDMYAHCIGTASNPVYAISTAWLERWRLWVKQGKRGPERQHPGPIDNSPLLCGCESRQLKYDPKDLYRAANFNHATMTLLSNAEGPYSGSLPGHWKVLHDAYGCTACAESGDREGCTAALRWWDPDPSFLAQYKPSPGAKPAKKRRRAEATPPKQDEVVDLSAATPQQAEEPAATVDMTEAETEAGVGAAEGAEGAGAQPCAVCQECLQKRVAEENEQSLNYVAAMVHIKHVAKPSEDGAAQPPVRSSLPRCLCHGTDPSMMWRSRRGSSGGADGRGRAKATRPTLSRP